MKILRYIFDIIFPPSKTEALVRTVTELDIANKFSPLLVENTVCLSSYQEPLIRALITENKYHQSNTARLHLATLLSRWIAKQTSPIVFIPIPLSKKRERERGYNQVNVVLRALKNTKVVGVDTTSLKRRRHTTPQTTLGRGERLKNLTSAFVCDAEKIQSYQNCTLVIVDDVLTTGATMTTAKASLTPHLHPTTTLLCLALAH